MPVTVRSCVLCSLLFLPLTTPKHTTTTTTRDNDISIWDVVYKVTWPSVLWGFGTAIGELPPYAMSRAARLSGDKIKELTELDDESAVDPAQLSLLERAKLFVHAAVQRYGFWAILVGTCPLWCGVLLPCVVWQCAHSLL